MKEYIEREAAENAIRNDLPLSTWMKRSVDKAAHAMGVTVDAIEAIPAADVVEVRKAKWVATDKYMVDKCSNCQFEMDWDDVPLWLVDMPHFKDSCPNCGAKMDGGADDDDN